MSFKVPENIEFPGMVRASRSTYIKDRLARLFPQVFGTTAGQVKVLNVFYRPGKKCVIQYR